MKPYVATGGALTAEPGNVHVWVVIGGRETWEYNHGGSQYPFTVVVDPRSGIVLIDESSIRFSQQLKKSEDVK